MDYKASRPQARDSFASMLKAIYNNSKPQKFENFGTFARNVDTMQKAAHDPEKLFYFNRKKTPFIMKT